MVAGLFVQHGLSAGKDLMEPNQWNEKGTFENNSVKKLLIQEFGRLVNRGEESSEATARFREELPKLVSENGERWLVKVSVMYWRAFAAFSPIFVTVRRPIEAIMESNRRSRMLHPHRLEQTVSIHAELLDQCEAKGALRIDSPRLIDGDYSQISGVFEKCGIRFDSKIADEWVAPGLWHY